MSYRALDTDAVLGFPLDGIRLIEASAGTGKTYTIANLYLRHIVEGRQVGEVLVVTFTVAATDELRGRIRARLFETLGLLEQGTATKDAFLSALVEGIRAAGRDQLDLAVKRLRLAVRTMDEAAIYTIHSFCQRALTEFAFNSGQQFQMEVLTNDRDLWRQAVQDWWRATGYPLDAARSRLFSASLGTLENFRALLEPLLGPQTKRLLPEVPDLDRVLDGFGPIETDLAAIANWWSREAERLSDILQNSKGLSRAQKCPYCTEALQMALGGIDAYFATQEILPPPKPFALLTAGCIATNRLKKPAPELDDPFFLECDRVWTDLQRLQRDLKAAALAGAAAYARQKVRESKRKVQQLSFDDLLTEMYGALQGPSGDALADVIREQFPVAMIDEFQDTDPVQYGIFRRLYHGQPECGLIMIGDPKQAIYSFRGGDIFTYMQAKEDVGEDSLYTLETNWRSTPNLIGAVNTLFRHRDEDAFVYGGTIAFAPIGAADKPHRFLTRDGKWQTALTLWTLPCETDRKGDEKPLSKDDARALTHGAVAGEVARLIEGGRQKKVHLGEHPLAPKDIAVLVRTSYEAAELRRALARLGVRAVSVEREGVFKSEEAGALELLLQAVLSPRDRELARLALASPLLAHDYVEIERVAQSEDDWMAWVDRLLELHETWQRKGFMSMFQQMLRGMEIASALSRGDLAERRLTNLLHLGELLQQASKAHTGMDALLAWYRQQREESAGEESELRLESDEDLVQIVTVHASKGLEYPVVFVPYLWSCRPRSKDGLLSFHQGREACLDAGSDAVDAHLALAEQERLAEDVRLAYVALTRAESALYLVWGRAGSRPGHAGQTALGYLLHPTQHSRQLATEMPDAFSGLPSLEPDLRRLAAAAGGDIAVEPLPQETGDRTLMTGQAPLQLAPRPFTGHIAADWRVSSFSALTRELHSGPAAPRAEAGDDLALRFPAGSHVGSYLHLLLERLDFQGDVTGQVLARSAQIAPRFNLDHGRVGPDAAALLERVVGTPLDGDGLHLAQVATGERLNELAFDLATRSVDIASLNALLSEAAGEPLPPLEVETFQGMVTGVIDLVFVHDGRFYIADYKSNLLGGRFEAYREDGLRAAVHERRYDLQYLLYTLALHRYLGARLSGYDYGQHFGGVYYLFLRGMRPETGPRCGVYFRRPDRSLIERLDRQVFEWATEGAS